MEIEDIQVRMIRRDLENIPEHGIPRGLSLRWFRPADESLWLRVHEQSERLLEITPELFEKEFGEHRGELARRQFFLMDEAGEPVATSTAWFDENYRGRPFGRVHWVAIVPEWQGRGLGNSLLSLTLQRLRDLGSDAAYLVTNTPRIPAINLYLKFGFVPDIHSGEERRGWRSIASQLRFPVEL